MNNAEIIKEKIKVELEKFKIYILVFVALSGGLYALLVRMEDNVLNKVLFVLGFVFLICLAGLIIRSNVDINKHFKNLEHSITNV